MIIHGTITTDLQDLSSGNKYFRPEEGLPGGGPELVVDPISTGRK